MPEPDPDPSHRNHWDTLPLLLSVPRTAALLGISRSAAYRLAESGDLPTKRMGGRVYIVTARLRAMLEQDDLGQAAA
ncbi:helix-turn-helix domain-containing protein [Nocardia sp. NPDC088792]|uniref:helix-turn-helix domain-containing protein n=1 Tax=Nocardia sp. NPDC088792 TaxID=3364332 RepID=UPI00380FF083